MIESKTAFARRLGVHKSQITRAAQAGRLVLTADGRVEVEASIPLWYATKGSRDDVAARHAAQRGAGAANAGAAGLTGQGAGESAANGLDSHPATGGATAATDGALETRAAAQARKESAGADLLELERAQKLGALIAREDADAAMKFIGGALRAALDIMPDQTAPLVAPITGLDEVHALLREAAQSVLASVGEAIERQRRELEAVKAGA
jgi:hypothetical protein